MWQKLKDCVGELRGAIQPEMFQNVKVGKLTKWR